MRFPEGFLWGAGTSAYQIEGATRADGRGDSIWDTFCRAPGKVKDGATGDLACDHYRQVEADLDLMASLGLKAYRFSVAWPRVLPEGNGRVNQAGLDFYRRLAEGLLRRGIRPVATLYHWDLPQALEDRGGWLNRETADRFAAYTETVVRALGDLVPDWATLNEPWVAAMLGYAWGTHAPGMAAGWYTGLKAAHHLLLAHGQGVQALRAAAPAGAQIGITLNLGHVYPRSNSPADLAAAQRQDGFAHRWYLDPVLKGSYPADMVAYYEQKEGSLAFIHQGDLETICQPIDWLGVNYYSVSRVRDEPGGDYLNVGAEQPVGPVTAFDWEIWPQGLYDLLTRIKADYGDIPLYITENGAAFDDEVGGDGLVADPDRISYLEGHLAAAGRAIADGVCLKGYYAWTLLDNFEWAEGYQKRFGLTYVDFATQRRIPKSSWFFYQNVIRQNGLWMGV